MTCRRGDVVLVLFPDSNLRTANRQGRRSRVYVEVSTEPGKRTGLLMDSVIMTDNLATIAYTEIDRILGSMSDMTGVDRGFAIHTGAWGLVIQRRRSARTRHFTSFQASPEAG